MKSNAFADTSLNLAVRSWFVVAVIGQLAFAFTIASFYGLTATRGDLQAWNRVLLQGYVAGATMDNTALAGHILFATIISVAGALQLIPRIRARFPRFHRWNGRLFVLAAFTQGVTGLYLTLSGRKVAGDIYAHVAVWTSGVLLIFCAVMALRYAMARDFATHRRWALRLFLVASGSWFLRVGLFLTIAVLGPIGFDQTNGTGPLLTFWSYAEFLLPLATLELYMNARTHAGAPRRMAAAAVLVVLTLAMGGGIVAVSAAQWAPRVRDAYDSRKSIGETLSRTIASSGIEPAAAQYRELKAAQPAVYNFDERELNDLGYTFIRARKFKEAIRIFQLNVEAFPQSSNTYDSLGEAYMDDGDKALAVVNYQKSLQLNPKNIGAVRMLQILNAR